MSVTCLHVDPHVLAQLNFQHMPIVWQNHFPAVQGICVNTVMFMVFVGWQVSLFVY